jgi:multidrug efflux pump subunit AcrA (membrane-fusion protein)
MRGVNMTGKWLMALAVLALLGGGAYVIHLASRAERSAEDNDSVKNPPRTKGNNVVLTSERADEEGIKDEPARQVDWQPRVTIYGRVVPNPRATIEVRAPFAGSLRAAAGKPWPELGSSVNAGALLGCLDIRVGPQEQLDMQAKLHDARLKEKNAEEVFRIQSKKLEALEAASSGVAPTDVAAARVQMLNARTELASARAAVTRWQDALADISGEGRKGDVWSRTLPAPAAGEITELPARPGMTVEAGALIARLVDFARPLVRLDMPMHLAENPPPKLQIRVVGVGQQEDTHAWPVWGKLVGPVPQVDATSQLAGYWYEIDLHNDKKDAALPAAVLRPGLLVKAEIPDPRVKATKAVAVPATALVYHDGRSFVYVREAPGRFERRDVDLLGRHGASAILKGGVHAGEPVVYAGAQIFLSEEFRAAGGKADDD